jgi:hypothetical protein
MLGKSVVTSRGVPKIGSVFLLLSQSEIATRSYVLL